MTAFNLLAPLYQAQAKIIAGYLTDFIPDYSQVLYLGHGSMALGLELIKLNPSLQIKAVNTCNKSKIPIQLLKKKKIDYYSAQTAELLFPNKAFDVCISYTLLLHKGNKSDYLEELRRLTHLNSSVFVFEVKRGWFLAGIIGKKKNTKRQRILESEFRKSSFRICSFNSISHFPFLPPYSFFSLKAQENRKMTS